MYLKKHKRVDISATGAISPAAPQNRVSRKKNILKALHLKYLVLLMLSTCLLLLPTPGLSEDFRASDPWIAIEEGVLEVHEKYQPQNLILNSRTFPEKIRRYLAAGLWSSAEILLKNSKDPSAEQFRVELHLLRREYPEIYKAYRNDPFLFKWRTDFILGAVQGALEQGAFHQALKLLASQEASGLDLSKRLYLTSLAYWGLKDFDGLSATFEKSALWSKENVESPWAGRLSLLKTYFHLSRTEYDLAFENLGTVFDEDIDLALLTLIWGYFKLDASGNLFSVLQAFDESKQKSPYYIQTYRILSRSLVEKGDLRGAIEMDQRVREELRTRVTQLEKETELLKKRVVSSSISSPAGLRLSKTLYALEAQYGQKREIRALLWYIGLKERQEVLRGLKGRERRMEEEQWSLHMAMIRSCMSIRQTDVISPKIEQYYQEALRAADRGEVRSVVSKLKLSILFQPDGPYAEEGHFRLGNLSFNAGRYGDAIQSYKSVLSFSNSPLYRSALYKLAWSHYLNGKPEEAVKRLVAQEIDFVEADNGDGPCHFPQTPLEHRESFRLLVLSLESLGGAGHLVKLMAQRPAEESFPFVSEVADDYESKKRLRDLLELAFSWTAVHPLYRETPFFHQRAIGLIQPSEQFSMEDVLDARKRFVTAYEPTSLWAEKNGEKASERLSPTLLHHLQFLMQHYYEEGKKGNNKAIWAKALPWYRRYLAYFPESPKAEMQLLYAGLLKELNEQRLAAYKRAYLDPLQALSAEAGYQEIELLEQIHHVTEPEIRAGHDRFVMRFPFDARAKNLSMRLAELAFEEGDYLKSRRYAKKVFGQAELADTPFQGLALEANRLIVQGYLKEKAYAEIIVFLERLLSEADESAKGEDLQEFKPILALSYFQRGEAQKNSGQKLAAATSYWKSYEYGPENETGPLALFEAGVLWDTKETRQKAEEALHLFYTRYVGSSFYHTVMMRLGALYHETGRPKKGAEIYEEASRLPISTALSRKVLDHAMDLYEEAGYWEKVFLHVTKRAKQVAGEQGAAGPLLVKAADMQFKLGEKARGRAILNNLIETSHQNIPEQEGDEEGLGPDYLAKAHFLLAESKIADFAAIKLVEPLEKSLQKKTQLFEDLLNDYRHAMNHPSPAIVLNANFRIGEICEEFSLSLLKSERLPELSLEESRMYDDFLKTEAFTYIELAKEAYIENIELAKSMDIVNKWTKKSSIRLKRIYQLIAFNF